MYVPIPSSPYLFVHLINWQQFPIKKNLKLLRIIYLQWPLNVPCENSPKRSSLCRCVMVIFVHDMSNHPNPSTSSSDARNLYHSLRYKTCGSTTYAFRMLGKATKDTSLFLFPVRCLTYCAHIAPFTLLPLQY